MSDMKDGLTYSFATRNYQSYATDWVNSSPEENKDRASEIQSDEVKEKIEELKLKTEKDDEPEKKSSPKTYGNYVLGG
jgi:hypothetical protein